MRPTVIKSCTVEAFDVLLPAPFKTAKAERTEARNVVVSLELAGGARGIGEVAPAPHVTGEDQEGTLRALRSHIPRLIGSDAARWRMISASFQEAHPRAHSARAGLESALLDAWCRHLGAPLYQLFGGGSAEVVSDVTVPIVPPADAAGVARAAAAKGFRDLKIKVGLGGEDFERVVAVAGAAPGARLRLDGNQGLTPEEAVSLFARVSAEGISVALFEQPVRRDDLAGMRFVRERVSAPVAADESVITPQDAWRVLQAGAADVINIKLMKAGVLGALEIVGLCRAAGVGLMLGCMLETRLGISVAAHLAAGLGAFAFLDLDGYILTGDARVTGGFEAIGNRLVLSESAPGHGAVISEA
ncbi:MAG: dipeptide epimerase [Armatimonadetes bacterium]|nr:dipeptide epimerase [Armatimonadota bacterium]